MKFIRHQPRLLLVCVCMVLLQDLTSSCDDINCRTCGVPAVCDDCEDNFSLMPDKTCGTQCGRGYWSNVGFCETCSESCDACHGIICFSYSSIGTRPYLHNGVCLDVCPQGFYGKEYVGCRECHSSCKNCSGGESSTCTSCRPGNFLQEGSCLSECGAGFFPDDQSICRACDSDCLKCHGPSSSDCSSCKQDDPLKYLFRSRCYDSCPEGSIIDTSTDSCTECEGRCSKCETTPQNCSQCDQGYELNISKKCKKICPEKSTLIEGVCISCEEGCLKCLKNSLNSRTPTICEKCQDDQKLDDSYGCVCIDPTQVYDSEVSSCQDSPDLKKIKILDNQFFGVSSSVIIKFDTPIAFYDTSSPNFTIEPSQNSGSEDKNSLENMDIEQVKKSLSFSLDGVKITPASLSIVESYSMVVKLDLQESQKNTNFEINLPSSSPYSLLLSSPDDIQSQFKSYPINSKINYYLDPSAESVEDAANVASKGQTAVLTGMILFNPAAAIAIIRLLQSFEVLSYINIDLPTIVLKLLNNINFNIFKIIPSIFGKFEIDETPYNCNLHTKLIEKGSPCLSLNGGGFNFIYFLGFYVVKICVFLPLFLKKKVDIWNRPINNNEGQEANKDNKTSFVKTNIIKLLIIVNTKMDLFFYFTLIKSLEIDMFLGSWNSPLSLRKLSLWSILSNIFLLFIIVHNLVYVSIILKILFLYKIPLKRGKIDNNEQTAYKAKFSSFFVLIGKNIKEKSTFGNLTFLFFSLRDMLVPFFLLHFMNYPYVQLGACLFFNGLVFLVLVITRPFEELLDTIIEIFNISILFLLILIYCLLYVLQDGYNEEQKNYYFGYPILFFLVLLFLVNLLVGTVCSIIKIYKIVKKYWKGRKEGQKVQPEGIKRSDCLSGKDLEVEDSVDKIGKRGDQRLNNTTIVSSKDSFLYSMQVQNRNIRARGQALSKSPQIQDFNESLQELNNESFIEGECANYDTSNLENQERYASSPIKDVYRKTGSLGETLSPEKGIISGGQASNYRGTTSKVKIKVQQINSDVTVQTKQINQNESINNVSTNKKVEVRVKRQGSLDLI